MLPKATEHEEVRRKIQGAIKEYDELLSFLEK